MGQVGGLLEPLGRGAEEQTIGGTGELRAWKEPQSPGHLVCPDQGGRVGGGEGCRADHLRWGRLRLKGAPQGLPCQPPKSGFVESVFLPPWPEGLGTGPALRGAEVPLPHLSTCAEAPPRLQRVPRPPSRHGVPRDQGREAPLPSRLNLRLS